MDKLLALNSLKILVDVGTLDYSKFDIIKGVAMKDTTNYTSTMKRVNCFISSSMIKKFKRCL